jgi:GcrA cell cycle regulator
MMCGRDSGADGPGAPGKEIFMQSWSWTAEHCEALRAHVAAGLSFSQAAEALNATFGTAYTRNAVIGRARRMKLVVRARPGPAVLRMPKPAAPGAHAGGNPEGASRQAVSAAMRAEPVELRCVGVRPRRVTFDELAGGDCRYPYGGDRDGEAITFCGHPRFRGPLACTSPHYKVSDFTADMLFQGALGEMQASNKAIDPNKLAASLGFSGNRIKTLEPGCEIDFHFVDATTAEIGLNDHVYTLKKQ